MEGFLNIMEERLQKIEKDLNGDFKHAEKYRKTLLMDDQDYETKI